MAEYGHITLGPGGGIGRRAGFRCRWPLMAVEVRVFSWAPYIQYFRHHLLDHLLFAFQILFDLMRLEHRLNSSNRCPMHDPPLGTRIVRQYHMHGPSVVPHNYIVLQPRMLVNKTILCRPFR